MVPPPPLAPRAHGLGLPRLLPLCGMGRLGLGRRRPLRRRLVRHPLIDQRRRSLSPAGGSRWRPDDLLMRRTGRAPSWSRLPAFSACGKRFHVSGARAKMATDVTFPAAAAAGLLSFLSPCVL